MVWSIADLKSKFEESLACNVMEDDGVDSFSMEIGQNQVVAGDNGPWKIDRQLIQRLLLFQYRQRELEVFGQELDGTVVLEAVEEEAKLMSDIESTQHAISDSAHLASS